MKTSIIVAAAENWVIGKDNKLIWHLPADLKYFKQLTTSHTIIMGRKTYESIGKPLPNRTNVVITRNKNYNQEGVVIKHSLKDALDFARTQNESEAFIIGGAEIFATSQELADTIYLTEIHQTFDGDTFFQEPDNNLWEEVKRESHKKDEKNPHDYSFVVLSRTK